MSDELVGLQFECDTRILRVIHGRDAGATSVRLHHYSISSCWSFFTSALENDKLKLV